MRTNGALLIVNQSWFVCFQDFEARLGRLQFSHCNAVCFSQKPKGRRSKKAPLHNKKKILKRPKATFERLKIIKIKGGLWKDLHWPSK